MSRLFTCSITAIIALSLVNGALSQPAGSQRNDLQNVFDLLQINVVQTELELADRQTEELKSLQVSRVAVFSGLRKRLEQATRDERKSIAAEVKQSVAEIDEKSLAVLIPLQRERLQQLALQKLIPIHDVRAGLHHERVVAALEIDEAQNKAIAEKTSEIHARVEKRVEELTKEMERLKEEARREVLANLTAAQRQKYDKMFGRPVSLVPRK